MPETYKIAQVGHKVQWENEPNKGDYPVTLQGHEQSGEVLVFHDADSRFDPPKPGDELYGSVARDKRGRLRFKREKRPRRSGGGQGGGYGPEDIARITRSHSQEMAIRAVGLLPVEQRASINLQATLRDWADWFDNDVSQAAAKVNGQQQTARAQQALAEGQQGSDVPADTAGLVQGDPGREWQ